MKSPLATLGGALVLFAATALAQTPTPAVPLKDARLAVIGDSITEQKLYSRYMEAYLLACRPDLNVKCFNFGWSGERAPGFANRMANDCLPWKPTVATTCFGMNDGSYRAFEPGIGKTYENGMRSVVKQLQGIGTFVVVGSPGVVDADSWRQDMPDFDQVYNNNLKELRNIAAKVAAENDFPFADVFTAMMDAMTKAKATLGANYHVAGGDGVHPSANGQLVMAYAFLKGLGLDGNLGGFTVDLDSDEATATEGHKVLGFADGTLKLESSRYPFCFTGAENDPNGTRSILHYVPFNQDLNRFTLTVKGLATPKAEVTWGPGKKTFTKEQLEAGVNLAAEFLDNPFSGPFNAVSNQVGAKQAYETVMIKEVITRMPSWERVFADDTEVKASLDGIRGKLTTKWEQADAATRGSVKPVTHELTITPVH